ncbi:hypothetical protein CHU92_00310 [Flavobacterium cyanobacteriorum]|uniref:Uncharacterized protein n=1 Tax=Flavobacterium cyanobacteriorum TaxID=2022802 RepID=A0A256A910_9FLAO|nr:hypothetical protein [Flavobacterium cyanobacteriorum]OYQ49644.1 hypothetical protein CHU92_00310 [Flavobacterium cyanobacteriorum]
MTTKLINELQKHQPLKVEQIKTWLVENENYFNFLINESSCHIWRKFSNNKSKCLLLASLCSDRKEDCKAIEVYYKLHKELETYNKQNLVKDVLAEYEQIKDSFDDVYNWVEKYQGFSGFYGLEIRTEIKNELGQNITFQLDETEFETALKFNDVVLDIYCTEEYQIRDELNKTNAMFKL